MFCNQCGTEIPENAKFCNNCGYRVGGEEKKAEDTVQTAAAEQHTEIKYCDKVTKELPYMKYCDKVKKINKLTLITQFLSVILGLAILFLPIYQCKYDPSLQDIESWEQLGMVIENDGYIIKNFSIVDDIGKLIEVITDNNGNIELMMALPLSMFLISLIIVLIDVLWKMISRMIGSYTDIEDIACSTMIKYDEIKLEMGLSEKEKIYNRARKQSQNSIPYALLIALLDVIFCKFLSPMFMGDVIRIKFRYMQDISGVSIYMFILLAVFIVFLVIDSMRKKEEKEMLVSITEEKYQAE